MDLKQNPGSVVGPQAKGLQAHTSIPAGWMRVGAAGAKRLVADQKERACLTKAYARYMGGDTLERLSNWLYFKGHRRHRGTMYKPEFLAYAFYCCRAGWPKDVVRAAFDKQMRDRLQGAAVSHEFLQAWFEEEFPSGSIAMPQLQPIEAGRPAVLGDPDTATAEVETPPPQGDPVAVESLETRLELTITNGDVK